MSWIFSRSLMEMYADADYANSLFSQEGEVVSSEASCSDGGLFAQLNVMPTQHKFWYNDRMMEASRLSQFGLTLHLLTEILGEDVLMWYRAVFRAKTFHLRAKGRESRESDPGCGKSLPGLLARYDRDTRSWKTRRCSLVEDSVLSLETWPRWGMWVNGESYLQPTAVLPTCEKGSGFWLGTPTKVMSVRSENFRAASKLPTPAEYAKQVPVGKASGRWQPTPRCSDVSGNRIINEKGQRTNKENTTRFGISLSDLVEHPDLLQQRKDRFATPTTMDRLPPKSATALEHEATTARPGRSRPANLRDQVCNAQKWPTPQARDWRSGSEAHWNRPKGSRNLNDFVSLPTVQDAGKATKRMRLNHQNNLTAVVFSLPTPTASMYKGWSTGLNRADGNDRLDYTVEREAACSGNPGHLSPDWTEGMMGWPMKWTSLEPLDPAAIQDFLDQNGASGWADGNWQHRCSPVVFGKTPFRNDRIMAIGNGQVSLCVATAFTLLLERINNK